ncbi:hypothetical protein SD81_032435 [Tolypothrix campylonemoides VB511288]|nr:hypothetical protein SD81_032435 [Tolypothrix campylonemoides VB511288]
MPAVIASDVVRLRDGRFQAVVVVTRAPVTPASARWTLLADSPTADRSAAESRAQAEAARLRTLREIAQG